MKIFIIEDDASIREELSRFLQKYGYECGTDDDFERIVEKCLAAEPDLAVVDSGGFHRAFPAAEPLDRRHVKTLVVDLHRLRRDRLALLVKLADFVDHRGVAPAFVLADLAVVQPAHGDGGFP